LAGEVARLRRAHGPAGITEGFLLALRNMEVTGEIQRCGVRAMRHGEEILAAHKRAEPVLTTAARLGLPPTVVLRQLLVESGHSAAKAKALVADPSSLPEKLRAELPAILEADRSSRVHGPRIRARSQAFEDAVGAHLQSLGVAYRTEEALRREHAEAGPEAPPLLTPDFLLEAPAVIEGREVHWLDAKNYPAVDDPVTARSTARQVDKYTAAFGPGALVFSGGVMCGGQLASRVLYLDGTHLGP
jgi:hypothetical protein